MQQKKNATSLALGKLTQRKERIKESKNERMKERKKERKKELCSKIMPHH